MQTIGDFGENNHYKKIKKLINKSLTLDDNRSKYSQTKIAKLEQEIAEEWQQLFERIELTCTPISITLFSCAYNLYKQNSLSYLIKDLSELHCCAASEYKCNTDSYRQAQKAINHWNRRITTTLKFKIPPDSDRLTKLQHLKKEFNRFFEENLTYEVNNLDNILLMIYTANDQSLTDRTASLASLFLGQVIINYDNYELFSRKLQKLNIGNYTKSDDWYNTPTWIVDETKALETSIFLSEKARWQLPQAGKIKSLEFPKRNFSVNYSTN